MSHTETIITGAVSTGLVAALTIPTFLSLGKRFGLAKQRYEPVEDEIYEDEDGQANEDSDAKFSTWIARSIALAAASLGLVMQIANGIYMVQEAHLAFEDLVEAWLRVGTWALITIQTVNLFVEKRPVAVFDKGTQVAASCVPLAIVIVLVNLSWRHYETWNGDPIATLEGIQAGLVVITFFASLLIQRRPIVYYNEKAVDGRYTTSFWGRITFAWAYKTLAFAKKHRGMTIDDIPGLSHNLRSKVLLEQFHNTYKFNKLWARVLWHFRGGLAESGAFITIAAILQFTPQLAMYNILKLIEDKKPGMPIAMKAYLWVFGLGLSMIVGAFVETWLFWIVEAHLGIPTRSTLSSLIFEKATRKKNIQGGQKKKTPAATAEGVEDPAVIVNENSTNAKITKASPGTSNADTVVVTGEDKKNEPSQDDDGAEEKKTRQAVINLIAVDTQRFQFFMTYSYFYPNFVVKMTVSMVFLLQVIGWAPLLAGIGALACNIPFNIYFSRKYTAQINNLMKFRDEKLAIVTEALQGIRQIKYSAIERQWHQRIASKRAQELNAQWTAYLYDIGLSACWISGPILLSAGSLAVYAVINHELTASVAFTTIAVLAQIEVTLAVLPELITNAIDAFVSINRIDKFINAAELEDLRTDSEEIIFKDATIAWPSEDTEEDPDQFVLNKVKLHFPRGELSVVSGKTGTGKTLLLNALLGEIELLGGAIEMPRAPPLSERHDDLANQSNWTIATVVSYVPQIPWIENATIKDNILFGLPYDEKRYKKTIKVCALEPDLAILQDGELTEVGSTGIGLSGGQKWRVSFARALYSRAGILILDDIFSAVDAHVGRQLYEEALTGDLGVGRTRILVTHHVGLVLPRTKYVVILGDGVVEHAGSVSELSKAGVLSEILEAEKEEEGPSDDSSLEESSENALAKVMSRASERKIDDGAIDTKGQNAAKKFVEDEKRETGAIKTRIYKAYLKASGGWLYWIPILLVYISSLCLTLARPYWINIWTQSHDTQQPRFTKMTPYSQFILLPPSVNMSTEPPQYVESDTWFYLGIYLALSAGSIVIGTLKYVTIFLASLRASKRLFEQLCTNVLHAPLRWLDTTPTGRILNRFTADFNIIDSSIANGAAFFMFQGLELIGITVVSCVLVSVYIIPLAAVLLGVVIYLAAFYLAGAREVKRLESNAKSPVFEQFGSFLIGITSVRAYGKAPEYIDRMYHKIDTHLSAYWLQWLCNRWMGFRQSMVGAIFATVVAFILISNDYLDASLAGFTLGFIIQYTRSIIWTIRTYAQLEMNMNAVERVVDYSELKTEDLGGHSVPAGWPTQGRLEIADLEVAYAPDLPSVLKGLTFSVEKNQRIGIVGRTGSGKSTFTLALFRFLSEFRAGTIHVDGIDVSKIKLHDLRSRLAIIPQDPVLFSGTVRSNLDDFNEYSDAELRSALERVHLISSTANTSGTLTPTTAAEVNTDKNVNIFSSLSSRISEGGLNISQGQRQLLCLARAIARKPKIMVLDEATSAVDMATDELIQKSIRSEFANCTLLVIAHRLSTIADFDKILVMGDGVAKEFGTPKELLEIDDGIFKSMVESSGERERLEKVIRTAGS